MAAVAVRASGDAVLVDVVVNPGAETTEVRGVDPWRKAVRVAVAARPRGGEANAELLRFLAGLLHVPMSSVRLVSGPASRRKTVAIVGAARDADARALGAEAG